MKHPRSDLDGKNVFTTLGIRADVEAAAIEVCRGQRNTFIAIGADRNVFSRLTEFPFAEREFPSATRTEKTVVSAEELVCCVVTAWTFVDVYPRSRSGFP